ncbi:uncharacterized protein LOC126106174 [Schistocerca cancellata]|uniref:uncharacterized protein LOC126106174 n=1 Tax=Schistocerca cancellata TaxID=274614 RepID=UPI002118A548|nr:uncharacterized protein LOC126106174 [Schistocerca cancellata]
MAIAAQHLCTAAVIVSQFAVAYGAPSQSLRLVACRDSVDVNLLTRCYSARELVSGLKLSVYTSDKNDEVCRKKRFSTIYSQILNVVYHIFYSRLSHWIAAPSGIKRKDAIAVLARLCPRLRALGIGKCDVSDAWLRAFAESCPNLKKLSVRSCDLVTDRGVQCVAYYCRGLQKLNIQDCQISIEGYRAVKRYCKGCIIEHTNPGFF